MFVLVEEKLIATRDITWNGLGWIGVSVLVGLYLGFQFLPDWAHGYDKRDVELEREILDLLGRVEQLKVEANGNKDNLCALAYSTGDLLYHLVEAGRRRMTLKTASDDELKHLLSFVRQDIAKSDDKDHRWAEKHMLWTIRHRRLDPT